MINVTYVEFNGAEHEVEAKPGVSLMEAARSNNVPGILADCGGACACATCHVMVEPEWLGRLPSVSEEEDTMLEFGLEERTEASRLSCQIQATAALDGIVLRLPESQY
ncbi:MAG: 2Fe-2S iron-sulfur cluster-binding protein [Gammaproteobacteria bacterium]|nr:2Fe-2S iron-sulfur cluster-binding protein [Gammaproteobacteria bacterium]MDE0367316.1 2Fe-2S iron-sulfur cluster-binding protein [Gammaproteobacteria bacterium]